MKRLLMIPLLLFLTACSPASDFTTFSGIAENVTEDGFFIECTAEVSPNQTEDILKVCYVAINADTVISYDMDKATIADVEGADVAVILTESYVAENHEDNDYVAKEIKIVELAPKKEPAQ